MECRLIRLTNGDIECERCKKNFGNFKDQPTPAGMGKRCSHHSAAKTFKRFAKSAVKHVASGGACFLLVKTSWASESCPLQKWVATEKKKGCGCSKKKSKKTS